MPIKIWHTADLHLGMKFTRGYAPEVQERLKQGRLETLKSMIEQANQDNLWFRSQANSQRLISANMGWMIPKEFFAALFLKCAQEMHRTKIND